MTPVTASPFTPFTLEPDPGEVPEHTLTECCARQDQERSLARAAGGEVDSLPRRTGGGASTRRTDQLLVANNLSDNAILLDSASGTALKTFDFSSGEHIPASYPYAVVATRDGSRGYCSLWNASEVAELDLSKGAVTRRIKLLAPSQVMAAGSHPTALLLSPMRSVCTSPSRMRMP